MTSTIEVKLTFEDWQRVLQILATAPWQQANPLIMSIGEQLRTAQGRPKAPDGPDLQAATRQ